MIILQVGGGVSHTEDTIWHLPPWPSSMAAITAMKHLLQMLLCGLLLFMDPCLQKRKAVRKSEQFIWHILSKGPMETSCSFRSHGTAHLCLSKQCLQAHPTALIMLHLFADLEQNGKGSLKAKYLLKPQRGCVVLFPLQQQLCRSPEKSAAAHWESFYAVRDKQMYCLAWLSTKHCPLNG